MVRLVKTSCRSVCPREGADLAHDVVSNELAGLTNWRAGANDPRAPAESPIASAADGDEYDGEPIPTSGDSRSALCHGRLVDPGYDFLAVVERDAGGWRIDRGALTDAIHVRWSEVEIDSIHRSDVCSLAWQFKTENGPGEAYLHENGICLYMTSGKKMRSGWRSSSAG